LVVDGVEGLPGVQEEQEHLELLREVGVKNVVNVVDMVSHDPALDEEFLGVGEKGLESGGETSHQKGSQNAVVRVGDGDGSSVSGEEGVFLGEEVEET
jgi:hypothetical protein